MINNSQLRQDIVSGDWIVIAPARAKKPEQLLKREKRIKASKKGCPFDDLKKSGHHPPKLSYDGAAVVENKYPAFTHINICAESFKRGPYSIMDGIGHHDLVITSDHYKNFSHLNKKTAELVFKAFIDYYKLLANDYCLSYVSIFHNWGEKAGASIYHPHYQIISLPIIPPDVEHSFEGSRIYYQKHKRCVHCVMVEWEKKEKQRIIYENKSAIVFAPFTSKEPFELRVFPKKHLPYFEDTSWEIMKDVVDALQKALARIEKKLGDPDYNFFIHTAPLKDKKKYSHYHWHIEIIPQTNISAGFELGTGIEINAVDPNDAAKILR